VPKQTQSNELAQQLLIQFRNLTSKSLMPIQQISEARSQVVSTIRQVASTHNADFQYLLNQAKVESGLDPRAKAGTSSAAGLFQFTSATWLDMVKRHGEKVGLAAEAQSLRSNSASTSDRLQILDLRNEPQAATALAAHLAADNAKALAAAGHKNIGPTELYLAHFLGSAGANTFLNGLRDTPNDTASRSLPVAAAANASVFYKNRAPQSYQQIYNRFSEKFGQSADLDQKGNASSRDIPGVQDKTVAAFDEQILQFVRAASADRSVEAKWSDATESAPAIPVTEEAMTQYLKNFSLVDHASGMTQMTGPESRDASQRASTSDTNAPFGEQNISPLASGVRMMLRAVETQPRDDGAQTTAR